MTLSESQPLQHDHRSMTFRPIGHAGLEVGGYLTWDVLKVPFLWHPILLGQPCENRKVSPILACVIYYQQHNLLGSSFTCWGKLTLIAAASAHFCSHIKQPCLLFHIAASPRRGDAIMEYQAQDSRWDLTVQYLPCPETSVFEGPGESQHITGNTKFMDP